MMEWWNFFYISTVLKQILLFKPSLTLPVPRTWNYWQGAFKTWKEYLLVSRNIFFVIFGPSLKVSWLQTLPPSRDALLFINTWSPRESKFLVEISSLTPVIKCFGVTSICLFPKMLSFWVLVDMIFLTKSLNFGMLYTIQKIQKFHLSGHRPLKCHFKKIFWPEPYLCSAT